MQTVGVEVWVVVSKSTPSSNLDVLELLGNKHDNLMVIPEIDSQGYAGAFNAGITRVRTPRVGFLLADDWLEPDAVEVCLGHDTDIVRTSLVVYGDDGESIVDCCDIDQREFEKKKTLADKADYLSHFLMFKRDKLLQLGGVDHTIGDTGPDDYDLIWSLLEQGASVHVESKRLYNYRDHDEPWRLTMRDPDLQTKDLDRILTKHNTSDADKWEITAIHRLWYGDTITNIRRQCPTGKNKYSRLKGRTTNT